MAVGTTPSASRPAGPGGARTDTRERGLEVALGSCGTRGYEGTSLDSIAAEAGVTKQTVLYYFASKEVLLDAVIGSAAADLASTLQEAVVGGRQGWAQIESVVRAVFRIALRRPEVLGLLREMNRLGPPHAAKLNDTIEPLVLPATAWLEAEMAAGRLRRHDARLLLLLAYSAVVGVATEEEVLRAVGIEPTLRSLAIRRAALLRFLHAALVPEH